MNAGSPTHRMAAAGLCMAALLLGAGTVARANEPSETGGKPGAGHPASEQPPAVVAPAPTKDWSVTAGFDWYSEYIFRGVDLLANDPVLVPSVIAKYKGFTAAYFGYFGDSDAPPNTWYEETDLSIDYTQTLFDGKLSLTGGALWYLYFDGLSGPDTVELYGKAVWSNYLNPYVAINWDIDEFHGGYGAVGINQTYDLSKPLNLPEGMALGVIPSAQLGIDFGYNSRATAHNIDWNDVLLGVNVPFYFTPQLCVHAQLQVSIALDSLNTIGQHNELIGNVGVSYSF